MSLAHLELLPLHWSSGECLKVIESVAVPVKGHLGFQLPSISSGQMDRVLADFHWQMLDVVGTPLPCPGPLGLGAQCGAWTPPSSWGTSNTKVFLPVFNHCLWVCGQSFYVSVPPTSLNVAFIFYVFS